MPKRKPKSSPRRGHRRTPDARALEWATGRLERCEAQHATLTAKLHELHSEIPRLRGIIAALGPTSESPLMKSMIAGMNEALPALRSAMDERAPKPRRIVAGMDVSRFVTPRPPVVAEPVAPDMSDENAALEVVDQMLGAKPE